LIFNFMVSELMRILYLIIVPLELNFSTVTPFQNADSS